MQANPQFSETAKGQLTTDIDGAVPPTLATSGREQVLQGVVPPSSLLDLTGSAPQFWEMPARVGLPRGRTARATRRGPAHYWL